MPKALLFATVIASVVSAASEPARYTAAIYAQTNAAALKQLFSASGFSADVCDEKALGAVESSVPSVLIVGEQTTFPPSARKALSAYLANKGNLVLLSPGAFDYLEKKSDQRNPGSFLPLDPQRVRKVLAKKNFSFSAKDITVRPTTIPGHVGTAFEAKTPLLDLAEVYFEIPIDRAAARGSLICFWARGDYEVDVLTVKAEDTDGNLWVGFEELGRGWAHHQLAVADMFRPGVAGAGSEGKLDPARIKTLLIGIDRNMLWFDKPGSFALGRVSMEPRGAFEGVTTSSLRKWRVFIEQLKTPFPEWIIDPFLESRRLEGASEYSAAENGVFGAGVRGKCITPVFEVPAFNANAKSSTKPGMDKTTFGEFQRDGMRRISLLTARNASGQNLGTAAEVRVHSGGHYAGAGLALFGVTGQKIAAGTPMGALVAEAAKYLVETPRVIEWTPFTRALTNHPEELLCEVTIQNPRNKATWVELSASLAGKMTVVSKASVNAGALKKVVLSLGAVPEDFPLKDFGWSIETKAAGRKDVWRDTANIEKAAINNACYMMRLMKTHRDGRISHHFFADIYGARALGALGAYLQNTPGAMDRNRAVTGGATAEEFAAAGRQLCDLLASVQDPDGSLPLGYSETERVRWVADAGSMALGMAQVATWQQDGRKKNYLDVARKYFEWKSGFYISEEKSSELKKVYGEDATWTRYGTYGLGLMSYDMVTHERWGERRRHERGPDYVLGIVLGVNGALSVLQDDPAVRAVMVRDAKRFIEGDFSAASYFQSEGAFWMWYTLQDTKLREDYGKVLESSFLPSVVNADKHDWFAKGGRETLLWLTLAYYYEHIENSPRVRAALVKAIWEHCSPSSAYSVFTAAERFSTSSHGNSMAVSKYAGNCSMIWFMELLQPGSTLLKGVPVRQ